MQIINLYKYEREGGGITVSPIKPDCEYTEMVRLVADEGKVLTKDGENFTSFVDAETADGWYEVDDPAPIEEEPIASTPKWFALLRTRAVSGAQWGSTNATTNYDYKG